MSEKAADKNFSLDDRVPFKIWWQGGGTGQPPTWQGFLNMTRERNEQRTATKAWKAAKKEAQRATNEQWQRGDKKHGDLRRWHREQRESQAVVIHEDDDAQGEDGGNDGDGDGENGAPGGG